jgi:hypothetical protein
MSSFGVVRGAVPGSMVAGGARRRRSGRRCAAPVLRILRDPPWPTRCDPDPLPVRLRIAGHAAELTVWPADAWPQDPDAVRAPSGMWVRLRVL